MKRMKLVLDVLREVEKGKGEEFAYSMLSQDCLETDKKKIVVIVYNGKDMFKACLTRDYEAHPYKSSPWTNSMAVIEAWIEANADMFKVEV